MQKILLIIALTAYLFGCGSNQTKPENHNAVAERKPEPFQTISNIERGYAFVIPSAWKLTQRSFYIKGPNGSSIAEVEIPANNYKSIDEVSRTANFIFARSLQLEPTGEELPLSGANWSAKAKIFIRPGTSKRTENSIIQFIAQSGNSFRLFYMTVPTREWGLNRDAYISVLRSFQMPYPAKVSLVK